MRDHWLGGVWDVPGAVSDGSAGVVKLLRRSRCALGACAVLPHAGTHTGECMKISGIRVSTVDQFCRLKLLKGFVYA